MLRLWKMSVAFVGIVAFAAVLAGSAWGETATVCVPEAPGKPVVTPNAKGECPPKGKKLLKYKLVEMGEGKEGKEGAPGKDGAEGKEGKEGGSGLTAEEQATLKAILPYIKFIATGVAGKPTVQFAGANVQIVDGTGFEEEVNGTGNLVVGYNDPRYECEFKPPYECHVVNVQTGSHNLIVGEGATFTSYGGIVGGIENSVTSRFASVFGGVLNEATGPLASVSGGSNNKASNYYSSILGGNNNKASGIQSTVGGGLSNTASGAPSSVAGGDLNTASGDFSSVSGGKENNAVGNYSAILGGKLQEATAEFQHIP